MRAVKRRRKASRKIVGELIVKVAESTIDGFRYVAFIVDPSVVEKYIEKGRRHAAEVLRNILMEYGVPMHKIEEATRLVREGRKSVTEILNEYGIEPDWHYPEPEEVAAELVMSRLLGNIPGAPSDAQASEEPGYGLPEYSLYWNPDARSFIGRWYWSGSPTGDICFALIPSPETCNKIVDLLNRLDNEARRKGKHLFFAVWKG